MECMYAHGNPILAEARRVAAENAAMLMVVKGEDPARASCKIDCQCVVCRTHYWKSARRYLGFMVPTGGEAPLHI